MKSLRSNLYGLVRPVRLFVAACACAFLFFTQAFPAFADNLNYSSRKSDPRSGEANLTQIEKKSQEAVLSDPYSMNKEQKETNPGLNVDQGDADKEKMKNPSNTPKSVQSIEQKIEKALEKATD